MELRELRSFVGVAGGTSIHQVADKLHLTPAAVHKHLKNLEQELNVRLFERDGRRLRTTQAAEVLLPYLREAVNQCVAARTALEEWQGLRRGIVRLGAGPTMSSYVLPGILARFHQLYPHVDFVVRTGASAELINELRAGSLDLAMLIASPSSEDPDLEVLLRWDFEIVLVGRMAGLPKTCRLRSLKMIPFILFQKGARIEAAIDSYFSRHHFEPDVVMRFDSAEAIKAMVALGVGVTMVPQWTVHTEIQEGKLDLIRLREEPLVSQFALVVRKGCWRGRAVEALVEVARSVGARTYKLARC